MPRRWLLQTDDVNKTKTVYRRRTRRRGDNGGEVTTAATTTTTATMTTATATAKTENSNHFILVVETTTANICKHALFVCADVVKNTQRSSPAPSRKASCSGCVLAVFVNGTFLLALQVAGHAQHGNARGGHLKVKDADRHTRPFHWGYHVDLSYCETGERIDVNLTCCVIMWREVTISSLSA